MWACPVLIRTVGQQHAVRTERAEVFTKPADANGLQYCAEQDTQARSHKCIQMTSQYYVQIELSAATCGMHTLTCGKLDLAYAEDRGKGVAVMIAAKTQQRSTWFGSASSQATQL